MGDRGNIKLVGEHTFPHPAYLRKGFPIGGAKLKPTSFEDFLKLVPAKAEET